MPNRRHVRKPIVFPGKCAGIAMKFTTLYEAPLQCGSTSGN